MAASVPTLPGADGSSQKPSTGLTVTVSAGRRVIFAAWSHTDDVVNLKVTG